MKKMLIACLLLASLAATASADVILTGTKWEVTVSDPVSVGSVEGLVSYTVSVENISGIPDYNPTTFTGLHTIVVPGGDDIEAVVVTGELHNDQYDFRGQQPTPFRDDSLNSPIDTCWLFDSDTDMLIASSVTEPLVDDATSGEPSIGNDYTGFANYLKGGFALEGAGPFASQVDILRVVVREGESWNLDFMVAASGQDESFVATIPEPGTMSLLVLGGLGFMVRRRRHGRG